MTADLMPMPSGQGNFKSLAVSNINSLLMIDFLNIFYNLLNWRSKTLNVFFKNFEPLFPSSTSKRLVLFLANEPKFSYFFELVQPYHKLKQMLNAHQCLNSFFATDYIFIIEFHRDNKNNDITL
jgi:hypothetical protein